MLIFTGIQREDDRKDLVLLVGQVSLEPTTSTELLR